MSSFVRPLVVSPIDGRRWRLYLPFTYHCGSQYSKDTVRVPAGFVSDFASIPKFLWFLPYWAKYNKAPILHDFLYQYRARTRKEADDIFLEAMLIEFRKHLLGKFIAYLEYWAVRAFGWMPWLFYHGRL